MDLHVLSEARKKSTRHREKQRVQTQYLGREAKTVRVFGWRRRAVYIMRELKMSMGQQRIAMSALSKIAQKRGARYLNDQTTDSLTQVLQSFQKNWQRYRDILPRELRRPGVSGVYHTAGTLRTRSGLERVGVTTIGKPASSKQLRMNIAHLTTQKMTKKELETHPHPDVRRLYGAIRPDKVRFRKDSAVVWTADDKPFYILGRLTKPLHRTQLAKKQFDILLPRAMDHRGRRRKIRLEHLDDLNQWTKWRTMMRTKDMVKLETSKPNVQSFAAFIKKVQGYAWKKAKPFYETYQNYKKGKLATEAMRKMYRRPDGGHRKMPPEHKAVHDATWHYWKAHEDKLLGKMPEVEYTDKATGIAVGKEIEALGDSYTWYLWLLASEQQHGIRVSERRNMPENKKLPTKKNPVQARPEHWTIQPVGREEVPRWDTSVLKGIGFSPADFHSFEKALEKSNYKLGHQGVKAISHLWIPLVGNLGGIKALPSDISDYLSDAKSEPKTGYIVGREGGKIVVRKDLALTQYFFQGGTPRRSYSLIPAIGYLQHFDSPKHGGERLVHGQARYVQPPKKVRTKMGRPTVSRMRLGRQVWRKKQRGYVPPMTVSPEQTRKAREQAAANVAERIMRQSVEAVKVQQRFMKRKRQRENIPAWQAPRRKTGFMRVAKLKPIGKEGLMQDISGQWELPSKGKILGSKVHPVTGQRLKVRRQSQRKRYAIRGAGVTLRRKWKKPVRPPIIGMKKKKIE